MVYILSSNISDQNLFLL